MDERRTKHLELIQAVLNRLANGSFAYKGWAITIVAGLFALAIRHTPPWYYLVALIPILAFWGLDAYYLWHEWLFRKLYDGIRKMPLEEWEKNAFTMDTKPCREVRDDSGKKRTWWSYVWSKTVAGLYVPMALIVIVVTCFAFAWQKHKGG